jgi:hypothetical protein
VATVATTYGAGERGEIHIFDGEVHASKTCTSHTEPPSGRAHASCCH